MNNPNRLRTPARLIPIAALASLAVLTACTSGDAKPKETVTVTHTVPAPTPTSEKGIVPTTSEKLTDAKVRFQSASILAAKQIAEDATNPKSFTEAYGGTSVGNKRLELAKDLDKKAGFPEIFMSYDYSKASRQASFTAVSIPTPGATSDQTKFNSVTITFESIDPGLNNLDRQIAAAKQLTAQDYLTFLDGDISAREVAVMNDSTVSDEQRVSLTLGPTEGTYQVYKPLSTAGHIDITDGNSELLDGVSRDMQIVAGVLHQGLVG
ncbi:MAG: hypothetical protein WDN27_03555 [Candidatus Saccharibacteria bacterium]